MLSFVMVIHDASKKPAWIRRKTGELEIAQAKDGEEPARPLSEVFACIMSYLFVNMDAF